MKCIYWDFFISSGGNSKALIIYKPILRGFVAGIVTPKIIEKGVTAYSKSIKITVVSTGRYYEIKNKISLSPLFNSSTHICIIDIFLLLGYS